METWTVLALLLVLAAAAGLASMWKDRGRAEEEFQPLPPAQTRRYVREFSLVSLSDAFEPELAAIWEPQIEVLRLIREGGVEGIHFELLRPVHRQLLERYPELYEGSDLESWLEAMESAELITWSESVVKLTAVGMAFLKCRPVVTV